MIALLVALVVAHPGYAKDIQKATAALESRPHDPELLLARATLLRRDGRLADALRDLDHAEGVAPNRPEIWLERGLTWFDMGRLDRAEIEMTRYLDQGLTSVDGLWARARIRAARGDVDGAVRDYDLALEGGAHVDLHLQRAELLVANERLDDAVAGLETGVTQTRSAVLRKLLCDLEIQRGNPQRAVTLASDALRSARVRTTWLLVRGRAREAAGDKAGAATDRAEALEEARSLVARKPSGAANRRLARVFVALGRYSDATPLLKKLLQSQPEDPELQALAREARQGARR